MLERPPRVTPSLPDPERGGPVRRRLPIGAEIVPGGVHLRVWASRRRRVEALFEGRSPLELQPEAGGYFAGLVPDAGAGARYQLRLDGERVVPDPASRWQPEGPHGPSVVVDPTTYAWRDAAWPGVTLEGQVIQEVHIGTFTREGSWAAAIRALPELADVGITLVEVMPIAEFPGRFGWGYDGVDLFAPTRLYGPPDDVRRFVDASHELGLGVILDVVYNHLGPDGNYLGALGDYFRGADEATEWGDALAFDGPPAVRELFIANAVHWIDEYHLDGLRLDATQSILDRSPRHVLADLAAAARAAAGRRSIVLVAENEPQDVIHLRPQAEGGHGLDALWNDDFHHAALVAATGRAEAYCRDYRGSAQELLSAAKWGFLYQGQRYAWQSQPRGTPALDLPRSRFVAFLQNHDQVANGARGARGHELTTPGRWRALTALLLLAPHTPMLFQGQEWGASSPFVYFADHAPELAARVAAGRLEFLSQFPSLQDPDARALPPDPSDPATFERCRLDRSERDRRPELVALHRDLLALRRTLPRGRLDGAVLGPEAFVLRLFGAEGFAGDRLLLVNLGAELPYDPAPEPLLAPPLGAGWEIAWSSEAPRYGGAGTPVHSDQAGWRLQAHAAALLAPAPRPGAGDERRP